MIKKVTSVTVWEDASGTRLSITYCEIDSETRTVVKDNIRENYVLYDGEEIAIARAVENLAQNVIGNGVEQN